MIDWKSKLASRKFWALLAGLATSILGGVISTNEVAQVVGIIGAVGSVAVYIFGEATVDASRSQDDSKAE